MRNGWTREVRCTYGQGVWSKLFKILYSSIFLAPNHNPKKQWVFKSTSFSLLQKHISNDNFHFSQRIYTGYVLQNHWTESSNVGCQIDWWRRPVYPKKTTDKLYHYIKYTSSWVGFELTTLVVIGTDCTGTCKSNHHMITTMTTPSSRNITI